MDKWHRHFGVYGFCFKDNNLLVIHKNGGPYSRRYDLPGGGIEHNELIIDAIHREFLEETGIYIRVLKNIGVRDYILPWTRDGYDHTHCHHVAIYYEVEYIQGNVDLSPKVDDSSGAEWIDMKFLDSGNSSPLVLEAVNWYNTGKLSLQTEKYDSWVVKN